MFIGWKRWGDLPLRAVVEVGTAQRHGTQHVPDGVALKQRVWPGEYPGSRDAGLSGNDGEKQGNAGGEYPGLDEG